MTRSSCEPNRCVNLSRARCADSSSPVVKQARNKRSRSIHEPWVSEVAIRERGKKPLVGTCFDSTALACRESCSAFAESEFPLSTNMLGGRLRSSSVDARSVLKYTNADGTKKTLEKLATLIFACYYMGRREGRMHNINKWSIESLAASERRSCGRSCDTDIIILVHSTPPHQARQ